MVYPANPFSRANEGVPSHDGFMESQVQASSPYDPSPYAANRAAGMAVDGGYGNSPYANPRGPRGGRGPIMSRRALIGLAGGIAAVALAGGLGVSWYTHRAVACTVNGQPQKAPVGSTASNLVERGFAHPTAGNLVSVAAEGETPAVLRVGGGDPYTLTVNGQVQDPETWRLAEGDDVVFTDGANITEPVSVVTAETPCGVQMPDDSVYLAPIGYVQQWGRNGVSTVETGEISGRTVDLGVTQEPQDLIIACGHINPEGGYKVALTFDDGPSLEYTPQYLDILARYGARATFFNLGSQVDAGPEYAALSKRCADEGHQVASHTYSHAYPGLSSMTPEARDSDISRGFESVSAACGVPTEVMRPPYGEFRASEYLQYLANGGNIAYSAYWTVDTSDWDIASTTGLDDGAFQIVANATAGLSGGSHNGAIILMHDAGGDRTRDVAALPRIIEAFQGVGYELVTMDEMIASDPSYPEWVWSGYVERPEWAVVPTGAS